MESRAEPRFETRSSASIEVIRDKVYNYATTITEVSGVGLRLEMAQELTVGEDIRLLVNGYVVFARVRRCIPSETGFIIGIERVDDWSVPSPGSALIPQKTEATSHVKVLGRPKLKNPLDNLHGAALRALFADPRLRSRRMKFQAGFIATGCIVLAGWAGIGASVSLHGKPKIATPAKTVSATQLPVAPKSAVPAAPISAANAAPAKPAAPSVVATNLVTANVAINNAVSKASSPALVAAPLPKPRVEAPPVQKTEGTAGPKVTAQPAAALASKISIKASDVSWVTACVDGKNALNTLLTKGYAGAIPFSRQATIRFGNAGAIELAIGNQPATKLGPSGQVRDVKVTAAGYELITAPAALNCNID